MKVLENKIAVITGGNSGIGRASAKAYSENGAELFVLGRSSETLESLKEEIPNQIITVQGDVVDLKDIDKLLKEVKARNKKIDILFINAGVTIHNSIEEVTEEDFDKEFNINFKGAYFTLKEAIPLLNKNASVILTTSCLATMGLETLSVYSATKAALESLAKTASAGLRHKGIRVNCLVPGTVRTPIYERKGFEDDVLQEHLEDIKSAVPLQRMGTVDEVARAALFLASDKSFFMLGSRVVVDGGMSTL